MILVHGVAHTLASAEALRDYLDREILAERARLERPVQVRYLDSSSAGRYTYSDPSGTVEVGDTVEVNARGVTKLATVVGLGRGSAAPRELKPVLAVLTKRVL